MPDIDLSDPVVPAFTPDDIAEFERDRDLGAAMLAAYVDQYLTDDLRTYEVVAAETPFVVHVQAPGRRFHRKFWRAGLIDLVLRERTTGGILLVDHKTIDPSRFSDVHNAQSIDMQASGYMAAYHRMTGVMPVGFMFNMLVKRAAKPPELLKSGKLSVAKNATSVTPELFRAACLQNGQDPADYAEYIAHLEANRPVLFNRTIVSRTADDLAAYDKMVHDIADQKRKGFVCRNVNPLVCPRCAYRSICELDTPEARQNFEVRDFAHDELAGKLGNLMPQTGKRRKTQPELLTYSRMQSFLQCRQRERFEYDLRLKPRAPQRALRFGSGIHLMLAMLYDYMKMPASGTAPDDRLTIPIVDVSGLKRIIDTAWRDWWTKELDAMTGGQIPVAGDAGLQF